MVFDFSFILVAATALTGVIWGIDSLLFKARRVAAARARGIAPENVREPIVVEYARSFFPVILIVLVIRSFLFEPFRIPSDSMMPTLLDGDFIFVNKFAYGLRLPVINTKVVAIGAPERGDVIVFRLPSDPSTNYIKRLVGLPG
ncbi:MAG: signal peptidase I, partial [Steroidobacteraceae bacterium]